MIYCSIQDLDSYTIPLSHSLKSLKEYISINESNIFQKGKFEIESPSFFGIGLEYETKEQKECIWEAHQKYLDVHYYIEGSEKVLVSPIQEMDSTNEYNEEHDYQFFNGEAKLEINCKPGDVLIFKPEDIHKTGIINMQKSNVLKIVFKILLQ